ETNIKHQGDEIWSATEEPDWVLPLESDARQAGIDLSVPYTINNVTYPALPGMELGYYTGSAPDMGAMIRDAGGIANIQNVTGGAGNDMLVGNGGNVLTGGGGRNVLIAGGAASTLVGGPGDDLLIAGTTAYDTDPQWQAAFTKIMQEWTRTNVAYADRVNHLQ